MPTQSQIMMADGYLDAPTVAELTGQNVTTLYRRFTSGSIRGAAKVDGTWYIHRDRLLEHYAAAEPIRRRIEEYK